MNLLLDTCGPMLLIALAQAGSVLRVHASPMQTGHAEAIMPALAALFEDHGLAPDAAFDKIGVTVGPGSFTGLRVGLSVARARAAIAGTPIVPLNRLQCMAVAAEPKGPVRAQLDARRGEHFVQRFSHDGDPLSVPQTIANSDLAELAARFAEDEVISEMPSAESFAAACARLTDMQVAQPHGDIRPLYVRAPDAKSQPAQLRAQL